MFSGDHLDFHFPMFTTSLHMIVQFLLASSILLIFPSLRPSVAERGNHRPLVLRRSSLARAAPPLPSPPPLQTVQHPKYGSSLQMVLCLRPQRLPLAKSLCPARSSCAVGARVLARQRQCRHASRCLRRPWRSYLPRLSSRRPRHRPARRP